MEDDVETSPSFEMAASVENPTTEITLDALGILSQEYETQFFGFTPKAFSDGLFNAVTEYVYDGLTDLTKVLKTELKQNSKSDQELRDGGETIFKEIKPDIGKAFDRLETYVFQNVFRVPPDVVLKEDQIWCEHPTASQAATKQLEENIQTLEKKLQGNRYVNARLRQELADTEPLLALLRQHTDEQTSLLARCNAVSDACKSMDELRSELESSTHIEEI